MEKKKKIKIAIAVLAIIIIAAASVCFYFKWEMSKSYSVVYLATGEIYIGKLSCFPKKFELNDTYRLQAVKDAEDETKTNFQLTPLDEALWAPKKLYVNPDQIVFFGPIEEGSKAGEALRDAGKIN